MGSHGKNFTSRKDLGTFNVTILLHRHLAASSGLSACVILEMTAIPSAPLFKTVSTFFLLIPPSVITGISTLFFSFLISSGPVGLRNLAFEGVSKIGPNVI